LISCYRRSTAWLAILRKKRKRGENMKEIEKKEGKKKKVENERAK
jgi:hypothetical protein